MSNIDHCKHNQCHTCTLGIKLENGFDWIHNHMILLRAEQYNPVSQVSMTECTHN